MEYARVLVEVSLNQALVDEVIFEDEHEMDISQPIIYEWKPIKCTLCKLLGHEDSQCRRKKTTTAVRVRKEGTS